MNELEIKLSRLNRTERTDYPVFIDRLVRKRYSISAELAILRQRDTKPEEFAEYNEYVEACKAELKQTLGID